MTGFALTAKICLYLILLGYTQKASIRALRHDSGTQEDTVGYAQAKTSSKSNILAIVPVVVLGLMLQVVLETTE